MSEIVEMDLTKEFYQFSEKFEKQGSAESIFLVQLIYNDETQKNTLYIVTQNALNILYTTILMRIEAFLKYSNYGISYETLTINRN